MCLYLVSLCYSCFRVFGLTRLLTSHRTSTIGSGVMRCDGMLMLFGLDLFITQPWLCDGMLYKMFEFDVLDAHQSSCVKLRCLCIRHLTQPFLESSISYTWINFSVAMMGLKCGFYSWWCHVVTCLTWPFWSLWSVLFWDTFWFLVEN